MLFKGYKLNEKHQHCGKFGHKSSDYRIGKNDLENKGTRDKFFSGRWVNAVANWGIKSEG